VISLYGPTYLQFGHAHPAPRMIVDSRARIETFLGGPPAKAAAAYAAASPINFVTPSTPPTLLIHGMRDSVISPDESARLEQKLQEAGVKHMFLRLEWATHRCDVSFGGPCGQVTTYAIERFLDAVMAAPPEPDPKSKPKPKTPSRRGAAAGNLSAAAPRR
jgi:acetyl esterase/lipase